MTPWLHDPDVTLYHGDNLDVLRQLPDRSVHMCATSPPFYGLRSYLADGHDDKHIEIGLEDTPDQWVERLIAVFREVRRVLRDDGTLWVEIGDSYSQGGGFSPDAPSNQARLRGEAVGKLHGAKADNYLARETGGRKAPPGYKPKDLLGQPWLLAFALRADGWYLRSEIIWARPNPMPESVTDRPTKSHSTVFLLSKRPRYYFDADAIREKDAGAPSGNGFSGRQGGERDTTLSGGAGTTDRWLPGSGANARSVWTVPTQPTPFAHFATWPEALVRRMILAGTSERGCCPECGAPWTRDTAIEDGNGATIMQRYKPRDIGLFLVRAREAKGLRQGQVAELFPSRTGGLTGCVSNWELGKNVPTPDQWEKLRGLLAFSDEMDEAIGAWHAYETRGWAESPAEMVKRAPADDKRTVATVGWSPSCHHDTPPVPCTVLDPFAGSATTMLVARNHGRHSIGIELNADYLTIAARRLQQLSLLA